MTMPPTTLSGPSVSLSRGSVIGLLTLFTALALLALIFSFGFLYSFARAPPMLDDFDFVSEADVSEDDGQTRTLTRSSASGSNTASDGVDKGEGVSEDRARANIIGVDTDKTEIETQTPTENTPSLVFIVPPTPHAQPATSL
ncbi:hypothetical protein D9758_004967 [Tetrapyrgos nigripes]|uniref:Uncharacterized protein n=1 Tax=Tetrapyrgos nigripes TaxID=182062 RepID=A0A8H5LWM8_9AGAR|nr:hypothetical protein D9758_004967 [Tetrapyrgos nigripes]